MNAKCVLCDVDHVLSKAFWRDPMIGTDWDEYHSAARDDEPIHDMVETINALHGAGFIIFGLTSRPEKWRGLTQAWLVRHSVKLDALLMRPNDDYRKSPEVKVAAAIECFGSEENLRKRVTLVLDDREDVTEAFRGLGLTVLQVHARRQ